MGNSLTRLLSDGSWRRGRRPEEVAAAAARPLRLGLARRRLARCVVGMVDDMPRTWAVLRVWSPWLRAGIDSVGEGFVKNKGLGGVETRQWLARERPELLRVLERRNAHDLALYAQGAAQFARQLRAMAHGSTGKGA